MQWIYEVVLDADVTSIAKPSDEKPKKFQTNVEKMNQIVSARAEIRDQQVKIG